MKVGEEPEMQTLHSALNSVVHFSEDNLWNFFSDIQLTATCPIR